MSAADLSASRGDRSAPRAVASERRVGGRRFTGAEVATICLLVVAPLLRLALLVGPAGSDDLNYFHFSEELVRTWHLTQLHHHAGRLAFLVVVGIPAALAGSITSGAIVNVLLLSLRDVAVVWFVRRETDARAAVIAAAIVSLNAISTTYAGIMIPDPLLSLLLFAAAVVVWRALGDDVRSTVARGRMMFAGGALTALAYSAKDPGILLVAPTFAWIAFARRLDLRARVVAIAAYGLGLAAVSALEMIAFQAIAGDFLYRSHALAKVHNATIVEAPNLVAFARAGYWNLRAVTTAYAASTGLLLGGGVVFVAALAARSRLAFFSATGLFIGAYLIFGSSSFTRFMPLPVQDRYFEPLVAFVAVGAAALIHRFDRSDRRVLPLATCLVAVLVLGSVPSITANAGDVAFAGVGRNAGLAIEAVAAARPDLPIFVSPMLYRSIEPFVSRTTFAALHPIAGDDGTGSGILPRAPGDGHVLRPAAAPERGGRDEPAHDRVGDALVPGFYIAHPWEPAASPIPIVARMRDLPIYLVVDPDQRFLGRFASQPPARDRAAVVRIRSD